MPKWSIVFPAYNEADKIEVNLKKTIEFFDQKDFDYEIVVVEDGGTDETLRILRQLEAKFSQLKIYPNEKNIGKGASVKKGILMSRGQYILSSDVDLATPIEEFDKVPEWFEKGFDIVIGSRRIPGAKICVRQPLRRRLLGRGFYILVHLLIFSEIQDTNCGFKCYTKQVAQDIFPKQQLGGWAFDVEHLYIAHKRGFKIKEVPVNWYDSGTSAIKVRRVVPATLIEMLQIKCNTLRRLYD